MTEKDTEKTKVDETDIEDTRIEEHIKLVSRGGMNMGVGGRCISSLFQTRDCKTKLMISNRDAAKNCDNYNERQICRAIGVRV